MYKLWIEFNRLHQANVSNEAIRTKWINDKNQIFKNITVMWKQKDCIIFHRGKNPF